MPLRSPNWLHGTAHNLISVLADSIPLSTHEFGDTVTVSPAGDILPQSFSDSLQEKFWSQVTCAQEFSKRYWKWIDPSTSFYDYCLVRARDLFDTKTEEGKEHYKMFMSLAESWGSFIGSDCRRQSLKFFFMEECLEGGETPLEKLA